MPKYHLDICCVKGRPHNWGLEIWSSQVGWGEYVCVCVCVVCVCAFSWPLVHNPNSPHISEHISFDFSSENLVVCQKLLFTRHCTDDYLCSNSSQLTIFQCPLFQLKEKGIKEQQFLTFNDL